MSTSTTAFLNVGPFHEVISGISTVFSFSDGVAKLTGPVGVGKTATLSELVKELSAEGIQVAMFPSPPKSPEDLQASLVRQFKLGADVSFRKALARHFASKPRDAQRLILVCDDAEQASVATLQALHGLREVDIGGQTFVSLLLVGDKTLNALLNQESLAALQTDISLTYTLSPMTDDDLSLFCSAYLQQRGKGRVTLTFEYLDQLQQQTNGLPGAVLAQLITAMQDPQFIFLNSRKDLPNESKEPALIGQVIQNIADQINNIPPETKRWLKPTATVLFTAAAASTIYTYIPPALSIYRHYFGDETASGVQDTAQTAPQPAAPAAADTAIVQAPQAAPNVATPADPTAPAAPAPTAPVAPAAIATTTTTTATTAPTSVAATQISAQQASPTTAAPTAGNSELEQVVKDWAMSWSNQDTAAYLGHYHTDFASLYHSNRDNWQQDRERSITRPANIQLVVRDFSIADTDVTGTRVSFWLDYQSPTYADSTLKELVIGRDVDGQLRILREQNREILKGSSGALVAIAPASTPARPAGDSATATVIGEPLVIQDEPQLANLPSGKENLGDFIGGWLSAWQHQDLAAYFRHYQADFIGTAMNSHNQWREDRTVKISRPSVIQLNLTSLEVVEDSDNPLLRLALEYHSSYYADRTIKEVRLRRRSDGMLEITMERNASVETLPLSRLLASNSLAFTEVARELLAAHRL